MANIKDLKKQIKSTKGTLKITTAMKLVSAAKLAKAQNAITSSRPYVNEMENIIRQVSALCENYTHEYLERKDNPHSLLLVISANKGLCGGYNSGLAKEVRNFLAKNGKENFKVHFIGTKVRDLIKDEVNAGKTYEFEKADATYAEMKEVADELAEQFKAGEIGSVYVAYNSFISAIAFDSTVKQVLPFSLDESEREELKANMPFDFKYEPSAKDILDSLIPETYTSGVYNALLDATAAEHGSRMSSMDSASSNCKELIKKQTLTMNKLRQAAITTELIEVVSGAESLNS